MILVKDGIQGGSLQWGFVVSERDPGQHRIHGKMEIYSRRAGQVSVDGKLTGNIRDKGGWILAKLDKIIAVDKSGSEISSVGHEEFD